MKTGGGRLIAHDWLKEHAVEVAFTLMAAGWLWYVVGLFRGFYFWADDLPVLEQAGSWDRLLEPYKGALSLVLLLVYRAAAEVGHLSYTPFTVAYAVSLVAVPLSYFFTTRHRFGPPLAAILAMPLLFYNGESLRPDILHHLLALVGGIFCAAALNRGRRADGFLAGALLFSLCSAGGGVVVAGACLVHNLVVRAPLRRWLAVLVPSALYACWWILARPVTSANKDPQTLEQTARLVRDYLLAPFYQLALGFWPLAAVLLAAFLLWGAVQLRQGLAAGANFLAWTAAMVAWPLGLIQYRGYAGAGVGNFRFAYLSLGFALLAIVPRRAIKWPDRLAVTNRRWLAAAAVIVLVVGGVRALDVHRELAGYARLKVELGRKAKGTMLVLHQRPEVIPDSTPITFFDWARNSHGTAGEVRALMDRYGSPFDGSADSVDQDLVDLGAAHAALGSQRQHPSCQPLEKPVEVTPTSVDEAWLGISAEGPPQGPRQHRLWSAKPFTIDVRRFGDHWVRLAQGPAGRDVFLTLPILDSTKPWEIRADGACLIWSGATSIEVPAGGTTLSGTTPLLASTSELTDVRKVEFHLTGGPLSDTLLGSAVQRAFGWTYFWDTTSIPNGSYTLTSVASNSLGQMVTSTGVGVTVRN